MCRLKKKKMSGKTAKNPSHFSHSIRIKLQLCQIPGVVDVEEVDFFSHKSEIGGNSLQKKNHLKKRVNRVVKETEKMPHCVLFFPPGKINEKRAFRIAFLKKKMAANTDLFEVIHRLTMSPDTSPGVGYQSVMTPFIFTSETHVFFSQLQMNGNTPVNFFMTNLMGSNYFGSCLYQPCEDDEEEEEEKESNGLKYLKNDSNGVLIDLSELSEE
jgi:hypothetical protein